MLDSLSGVPPVIIAVVAGLLIGSFLNVCIYRIPRDISVVAPRSFCPDCKALILPFDNVPLISFLVLRGRCRYCHARISVRYWVVECTTGILFGCVVWRYGLTAAAFKWVVFEALMVVLFWTDWEVEILPDELTLGGAAFAVFITGFVPLPGIVTEIMLSGPSSIWPSLLNVAAGAFVLSVPIWLVASAFGRVVKQEALGLGDVKLLVTIGSFLGLEQGVQALMLGTITGAVGGLSWVMLKRKKPLTQTLRFGCFLTAAAAMFPIFTAFEKP